jgi:hypothetical protein
VADHIAKVLLDFLQWVDLRHVSGENQDRIARAIKGAIKVDSIFQHVFLEIFNDPYDGMCICPILIGQLFKPQSCQAVGTIVIKIFI